MSPVRLQRLLKLPVVRKLIQARSGAVAMTFGFAMMLMMTSVGGAIDFSRWHSAKRLLSDSVDAAVLAGARTLQIEGGDTTAAIAAATSYYQNNTAGKVDLASDTIAFIMVDSNTALTATGSATMKTSFLGLIGIHEMTVLSDTGAGFAKASYSIGGQGGSNIEISLMLDVTGSMCDAGTAPCTAGAKITGLKEAAKRLVDMVIPTTQTEYYAKMALVPFATGVRVGPDGGGGGLMQALTGLNAVRTFHEKVCTNWVYTGPGSGGPEWGGGSYTCDSWDVQLRPAWRLAPCVTDRFYDASWDFDYTDDAPGSGRWLNAQDGTRRPVGPDSSNVVLTSGTGTAADPAEQWNYTNTGYCYDMAQENQMMPLTRDRTALKSRIDGLIAAGSTSGVLGTAWTWYTLSPRWNSIWTGDSRPASYSDLTNIQANNRPLLRKVAILMTDGIYNTYRSWAGADESDMAAAAKQMCANMKAEGIEIFTVGLGLNELSTTARARAEDILRTCGTDVEHFYSTINAEELNVAFQNIAYQLGGIALKR